MDGGGVLYDHKDPVEIARLMDAVVDDPRIQEAVVDSQDASLERLRARDFAGTLLRFVDQTLATPPRRAPEVPWDFWPQFEQFDRFEELRQFRPALYKALPVDPGSGIRDPGSDRAQPPGSEPARSQLPNHASQAIGDSPGSRIPDHGSRR
jgi:hypothetical protein